MLLQYEHSNRNMHLTLAIEIILIIRLQFGKSEIPIKQTKKIKMLGYYAVVVMSICSMYFYFFDFFSGACFLGFFTFLLPLVPMPIPPSSFFGK